jgi:hypothetical protein
MQRREGTFSFEEQVMARKTPWIKLLRLISLALLLAGATGCGCSQEPDRWAAAQQKSTQNPKAVSTEAASGSEFNRFFPQVQSPWDIVFKQEKPGFAQASLQQSGREVAVLSVFDTKSNPEAAEKFKTAPKNLSGLPLVESAADTTEVLAGNRFQVQVRSTDPLIGPKEREEWLAKFNLDAIGRIQ